MPTTSMTSTMKDSNSLPRSRQHAPCAHPNMTGRRLLHAERHCLPRLLTPGSLRGNQERASSSGAPLQTPRSRSTPAHFEPSTGRFRSEIRAPPPPRSGPSSCRALSKSLTPGHFRRRPRSTPSASSLSRARSPMPARLRCSGMPLRSSTTLQSRPTIRASKRLSRN